MMSIGSVKSAGSAGKIITPTRTTTTLSVVWASAGPEKGAEALGLSGGVDPEGLLRRFWRTPAGRQRPAGLRTGRTQNTVRATTSPSHRPCVPVMAMLGGDKRLIEAHKLRGGDRH